MKRAQLPQIRFCKFILITTASLALAGCNIEVNTTRDAEDANVYDGVCHIYSGTPPDRPQDRVCSLRAAIAQARHNGANRIVVPRGIYRLSLREPLPLAQNGIVIQGDGADRTIIDAEWHHPVFHPISAENTRLTQLQIRNGTSRSSTSAAGLNIDGGSVELNQVSFTGHQGSVLKIDNGEVTGFQVSLRDNRGGIDNRGRLELTDSSITKNQSQPRLAVLRNGYGGHMELTNITISGNKANVGYSRTSRISAGGVVLLSSGARARLNNVTIAENSIAADRESDSASAGLRALGRDNEINNSIISANTVETPGGREFTRDCTGRITALRYSLITRNSCELDAILGSSTDLTAQLGPLDDHLGSIPVHSLLAGSPALDAGAPRLPGTGGVSCARYDQRGVPRGQTLGSSSSRGRCDMGAYEAGNLESKISRFVVHDIDRGLDVRTIRTGDLFLRDELPDNFTIKALHSGTVGHVQFQWRVGDRNYHRDDAIPPFAITGENDDGRPGALDLANGEYTLRAVPYADGGASGAGGVSKRIKFFVYR